MERLRPFHSTRRSGNSSLSAARMAFAARSWRSAQPFLPGPWVCLGLGDDDAEVDVGQRVEGVAVGDGPVDVGAAAGELPLERGGEQVASAAGLVELVVGDLDAAAGLLEQLLDARRAVERAGLVSVRWMAMGRLLVGGRSLLLQGTDGLSRRVARGPMTASECRAAVPVTSVAGHHRQSGAAIEVRPPTSASGRTGGDGPQAQSAHFSPTKPAAGCTRKHASQCARRPW